MASSRLTIYLTESEREAIREAAVRLGSSEAYVIRRLIRRYLDTYAEVVAERANRV